MDDKELILGQYQVYNYAKERYIDRHFATNRFYMVLSIVLLFLLFIFKILTPEFFAIIFTAAFGMGVSILWWLNVDSYQFLIKIKYAKVLEYLETKLPEQPFNKEFREFQEAKRAKKAMVFSDFQKGFIVLLFLVFLITFVYFIVTMISVSKNMPM